MLRVERKKLLTQLKQGEVAGTIIALDQKIFSQIYKIAQKTKMVAISQPLHMQLSYASLSKKTLPLQFCQLCEYLLASQSLKYTLCTLAWRDYSLVCDTASKIKGLYIVLDLTKNWKEDWGGLFYATASESIQIAPPANSLAFMKNNRAATPFFTYVNHYAGKKKKCYLIVEINKKY